MMSSTLVVCVAFGIELITSLYKLNLSKIWRLQSENLGNSKIPFPEVGITSHLYLLQMLE